MMNSNTNLEDLVSQMYISNDLSTDMDLMATGSTADKKYYIFKNVGENELKSEIEKLNKELQLEKNKNRIVESKISNLKIKMDSLKVQLMEEKSNSKITECYLKEVVGDIHLWQEENVKGEKMKQILKKELTVRNDELRNLRDIKEQYKKLIEEKAHKTYENAETMTQNINEQDSSSNYKRKYDMANTEISLLKNEIKLQTKSNNNELKKIIKELLEYKCKYEKIEAELSETKRTMNNLNTLVEELENFKYKHTNEKEKRDSKTLSRKKIDTDVLACADLQVIKKNEIRNNSVRLFVGIIPPIHRVQVLEALCSNGIDMLKDVIQSEIYIEEIDGHMNLYAVLNIPTGKFEHKIKKYVETTILSS